MKNLTLTLDHVYPFLDEERIHSLEPEANAQLSAIHQKSGKGNDFLGWVNLPGMISEGDLSSMQTVADEFAKKVECVVVIGIGGSYLGAKCVIEALSHGFEMFRSNPRQPVVLFAGNNISEDYLAELLEILNNRSYAIVVISKSGTTTEPAIAFRIIRDHLVSRVGKQEASDRIIAITDASKGALRQTADQEGYRSFSIPDDVGGRYSVLTPVGLLPIAIAGFDISQLVEGARIMERITGVDTPFRENPAALYATVRNLLYRSGKTIEILVNYNPKLHYFSEWWKQLFGESEGKENKGIFPASVDLTTDLHSMGQYIQDGIRTLFETTLSIEHPNYRLDIPSDQGNLDKLNYLSGKRIDEINKMAQLGTILAHVDGGVPNICIEIPEINAFYLGQLIYFFEKSCAISGYLLGINPFDQPGVEAYKKNMFALLGKPGCEEDTEKIRKRLQL
jgi:glucose-6-phosphate isomerase